MFRSHLEIICKILNLGTIITKPTPVAGGLLHEIWHITTNKGQYAAKVLNPKIMQRPGAINRYETTEIIARIFFEKGIPAIVSITHDNKSVIEVDGKFFIVYPWVSGFILDTNSTVKKMCSKIATLAAQMHQLTIQRPELKQYTWDLRPNSFFENLITKATKKNIPIATTLSNMSSAIFAWNDNYHQAVAQLNKHTLISHGDLDQKNVLWTHEGKPIIIDWESARLINPTQEIMCIALDWSGISSGHIDTEIFSSIIDAYKKAAGKINTDDIQASFDCIIGNWLNWMAYNIEQSSDNDTEKQEVSISHIEKTLELLVYLTPRVQEELIKLL